jgi:hypothetical protein
MANVYDKSAAPDPTFAFVGGPCCPTLGFVIALRIMIAFYTLLASLHVFRVITLQPSTFHSTREHVLRMRTFQTRQTSF